MKRKTLILSLLILLCSGLVIAVPTFQGLWPDDNWKTSDSTPKFCVTITGNDLGGYSNLTLYIIDTDAGNLSATYNTNDTKACITSLITLNKSTAYLWKFGVVNQTANQTNSTARTIIYTQLGSAVQTVKELPAVISPLTLLLVWVFSIIVVLVLMTFFADFFKEIGDKVTKGIKGNV